MQKPYPQVYRQAELLDADSSEYKRKIKQAVRSERRRCAAAKKVVTTVPGEVKRNWEQIFPIETRESHHEKDSEQ